MGKDHVPPGDWTPDETARNIGLQYGQTPDEVETEILKVAITMPDLYQTLRGIFKDHPKPESLDDTGRLLHKIFNKLENHRDGQEG